MKVKVKALEPIDYNDTHYKIGSEFEIDQKHLPQLLELKAVEVIETKKSAKQGNK